MLQALRDKSSGWIATVILGLLTIPFAFFGMEQYLFQRTETFAAKIETPPAWWSAAPDWWVVRKAFWDKDEISADEFRSAFEDERQRRRQQEGENFDAREFEGLDNKRKILEQLVDQRVMRLASDRDGFVVGNAQVIDAIQSIPAFQVDGKFSEQRYRLALASLAPPKTPTQFDQEVRDSLKQSLVATRLQESAFVTPSEGQRFLRLLNEKRDVSYVALPAPAPDVAPVTPAEIASWYKAHPNDFRAPEMVTLEYVEINAANLPPAVAPDERSLRTRYDQEKARFVEPEQRLTSHILVKVDAGADAAAQKAAEAKARDLLAKAKAPGADFAALARQNSDDAGSKDGGGDLGWVAKNGQMVKPFEDAVFATAAGTIAGPVKSDFGWHIIQVRELKAGREMPFEQARPELERMLVETDRERAYNDLTGALVDQALKTPSSMKSVADVAKLQIQRIGPVARNQLQGVLANPAVVRLAFSEDAKTRRNVSDPIEVAPNHSVMIRVIAHTPERVRPLAELGPQIVAAVRADRTRKAAEAQAEAVVARLKKGETLAAVAGEKQWTVETAVGVQRGAPSPDPAASEAYFQVDAPAAGKSAPGKVQLPTGQMVVFEVNKVIAGQDSDMPPEIRAAFLGQLAPRLGDQDAVSVSKSLRKQMKVTIAEDRL